MNRVLPQRPTWVGDPPANTPEASVIYKTWLQKYQKSPQWPEQMTIVSVVWDDATYASEIEDSGLARASTFGIVVEATDAYLKTAAEVFADKSVRDVSTIPAGMIVGVHKLGSGPVPATPKRVAAKRRR